MRRLLRFTIFMLIALTCSMTIKAQSNWKIQNSGVSADLKGVDFITQSEGVTVGINGLILKTIDGGETWNTIDAGVTNKLNDVQYIDEDRLIIGGEEGIILYSYDAGDTWEIVQESGQGYTIYGIEIDPESGHGIAGGSANTIIWSEDFGLSWTYIEGGFMSEYHSASMAGADFGTVIGSNSASQGLSGFTFDGGESWGGQHFYPTDNNIYYEGIPYDCYFFSSNNGFTVGEVWNNDGFITTNAYWSSPGWDAILTPAAPLYGLDFADDYFGAAVGGDYDTTTYIYETHDGGSTWTSVPIDGAGNSMRAVSLIGNAGYAVGDNGEILSRNNMSIHNLGVQAIIAPEDGFNMGMEDIVVSIKNFGEEAESNFELYYTVDGAGMVTETYTETIEPGEIVEYTFATQADLSNYEEYLIEACTNLSDDDNPVNDCASKTIKNQQPAVFPYEDGFDSGNYEEGQWTFDPSQGNWQIISYEGQPAPAAEFFWDPGLTDYNISLTSPFLEVPADAENVVLNYDLFLSTYVASGNEYMTVEIYNGNQWIELAQYDNSEDISWQTHEHNVSDIAPGNTVQFRFRAWGADSYDINWWHIDNVKLYDQELLSFYGTVTEMGSGNPVEDAQITVGTLEPVSTNAVGDFEIMLESGTYDVSLQKEGYNPILIEGLNISDDYEWNPELTAPTIDIDPLAINVFLAPGEASSSTISISNNGNGHLSWLADLDVFDPAKNYKLNHDLKANPPSRESILEMPREYTQNSFEHSDKSNRDTWDILYNFETTGEWQAGIETNGTHIFTTDSRPYETTFHKYNMAGTFMNSFNINGASAIRDMAYNGEFFYGSNASMSIYKLDLENETLINTISASCSGVTAIRHIAYDPGLDNGNGGFWIGNYAELGAVDMNGNEIYANLSPLVGLNGSAYDPHTPDGPYLWLFSRENNEAVMHQFDIASQSLTGVSHNCSDAPGFNEGFAGGAATYDNGSKFVLLANIQQSPNLIVAYELAPTAPWIEVDQTWGELEAGSIEEININFDATDLQLGETKTAELVFTSIPDVGTVPVDITLTVTESQTQAIELTEGYSFISTCLTPENPDMLVVLEEVLNENLEYVRNQNGQQVSKIGPEWINNIGNWNTTEGYLFKMNGAETLTIEGEVMDPATPINIAAGYSFIAYLPETSMNAMDAFESIMNNDLDYIRNTNGNQLRKIGPNWVNGIGDVHPGQGYLVKTMAAQELVYPSAKKSAPATASPETSFFAFEGGNPAEAVYTLYIDGNLEAGDEVAAFNGDKMVGATVITGEKFENDLPIFTELVSGKGYEAGSVVALKVYDRSENIVSTVNYSMVNEHNARTANTYPAGDGEYGIAKVEKSTTGMVDLAGSIAIYPNPANSVVTIEAPETINSLRVYNYTGQVVVEKVATDANFELNVENFDSGVYVVEIETASGVVTKKVTVQ